MSPVKTYERVNARDQEVTFGISRTEEIYGRRKGQPDEPHRHDYYTVLILERASGVHKIDFNAHELENRQIYFVAPGQVHQVIETEPSYGFVMTFSDAFLIENSISKAFIENLHLFNNYGENPPLRPSDEQFATILKYAEQIFELYQQNSRMKFQAIGAFLKIVLIACNNICSLHPFDFEHADAGDNLVREFKQIVEEHYKEEHTAAFYAQQLHITADHLNRTIKAKMGKSPKEYLQKRLVTEAKRLLYFTDLTNKEVGYELGFSEPANFSAFFKRQAALSPRAFKKTRQPA